MRVLCVLPPIRPVASAFPLGFVYIARILRDVGHTVDIMDFFYYYFRTKGHRLRHAVSRKPGMYLSEQL